MADAAEYSARANKCQGLRPRVTVFATVTLQLVKELSFLA